MTSFGSEQQVHVCVCVYCILSTIVTMAKGIANGFPMGAVVTTPGKRTSSAIQFEDCLGWLSSTWLVGASCKTAGVIFGLVYRYFLPVHTTAGTKSPDGYGSPSTDTMPCVVCDLVCALCSANDLRSCECYLHTVLYLACHAAVELHMLHIQISLLLVWTVYGMGAGWWSPRCR